MRTTVMLEPIADASLRLRANIAGFLYLMTFLSGGLALFVNGRLIRSGDAATTATNILAHESLFRLGFAADLVSAACYAAVMALFYGLFKPVNKNVSLLAAFFSLVGCAVVALSCVFELASLIVLGAAQYSSLFKLEQLQALALMFLKLHAQGFNISLVFFGSYCFLIGYLIFRSTFLPRALGALMAFAGLGWLTFLLPTFLSPSLTKYLYPYILALGILGEGSLTLWLLAIGVNVQRWKEQAAQSGDFNEALHNNGAF
jgi:hypothetical protein